MTPADTPLSCVQSADSETDYDGLSEQQIDLICQSLYQNGWVVVEKLLSDTLVQQLRADILRLDNEQQFRKAGIGRDQAFVLRDDIRTDRICWLEGEAPVQARFMAILEQLMTVVNRRLYLGMNHFEAMYAIYEPGQFYKKHLDSFRGQRNRIMTLVFYLNPDWNSDDGGQFLLYPEVGEQGQNISDALQLSDTPVAQVEPEAGTVAAFLSEEFPHEVITAQATRYSIAVWFRIRDGAPV
ncbi:2OG-Fe(II) oxygenase [Oceanospirillum sediminis]|uniref:2OG-Fe(II) oxygenase n=1 Tax=Oceanospirillum sediminis TaxID=2760088 RepID=A0A839ISY0_9GAMM|nr:2OG-Fe(II) oxygenase [Oceanospirillum sediminis]MBB1487266.1 2OG-Fe(II) oxygenase [Oceanospirillum sediminis]